MRVLNVGGGASRDFPPIYNGWTQEVLDINPDERPDIVCDAKEMRKLEPAAYDAVECSHTLEHFYRHEVQQVLTGFRHVLKPDGFARVVVPDLARLFEHVAKCDFDPDREWYRVPAGPITFHDVLYGWGKQLKIGNHYFAHKCGFTDKSLGCELLRAGFAKVYTARDEYGNLTAFAFNKRPSRARLRDLGV